MSSLQYVHSRLCTAIPLHLPTLTGRRWFLVRKDSNILVWYGGNALAVCQAHRGLPVGFLLLRYSV